MPFRFVEFDPDGDDVSPTQKADPASAGPRRRRVDAERNVAALVEAATEVFARLGVDAPAKEITDVAGVGVGTLYRHFPLRSDLVVAVLEREIDACADAATDLRLRCAPATALTRWVARFTEFVGTKQGLAGALGSDDPALAPLRGYFFERVEPAVAELLSAGVAAGAVRGDVTAGDLLHAVVLLCQPVPGYGANGKLVDVFVEAMLFDEARCRRRGTPMSAT
jgi:AcrR family transcriptional regulator